AMRVIEGNYDPTFTLDLMDKDVSLAAQMAGAHLAHMPMLGETLAAYAAGKSGGWGAQDFSAVTHVVEQRFGSTISPPQPAVVTAFVLASFRGLFVTINPIKGATVFAVLTEGAPVAEQRRVAARATLIAFGLLLVFALFGDDLLRAIGISLAGVRVGGGILLMLLSIDIVFGHPIGGPSPGAGDGGRADVTVFPLATPIIAGPGALPPGGVPT